MAVLRASRHALAAVALLRCVAAHDSKACREFDHPDKGEWSHDEDCCAGNKQAACKAGYRYEKSGNVCFEGVTCRAYSYTCDKCTATEVADGDCDSHYDVETEDGEDYDCNINAWSACYFLWPISWVFLVVAIKQVQNLAKAGKESEARALWESRKKGAFYIFLFCTVMHFVATIWMGPSLMAILIGHCVILGVVIPLCCCLHGDKQVSATAVAPAPVSCGPGWSAHQNIDMCGQGDVEIIHNWRGKHSIEELMRKVEQNDYSAVCVGSFGHAALKKFPYQLTAGHCKPSSGYTNTLYIWSGGGSGLTEDLEARSRGIRDGDTILLQCQSSGWSRSANNWLGFDGSNFMRCGSGATQKAVPLTLHAVSGQPHTYTIEHKGGWLGRDGFDMKANQPREHAAHVRFDLERFEQTGRVTLLCLENNKIISHRNKGGWMVAKYPVGTQGVDYHLVVTLPGSQAEEEMPASAKVAPEPEAEP